jgi:integrase
MVAAGVPVRRARRGTGGIYQRGQRFVAQVDLGTRYDGKRDRRTASFSSRGEAEAWLLEQRTKADPSDGPVKDQLLADYLLWWLANEAPKGKPGRPPLAATTLQAYRINVEKHLVPALGSKRVADLTVTDLDNFASAKLAEGYAPSTVNRIRETLRSALSTAVRQDRLARNVARYGGGVGVEAPPVDFFNEDELARILEVAAEEHYGPIFLLLARSGLRLGEACGLRWSDVVLRGQRPRLTVVWQLDKWGNVVRPKSPTSRRTIALRSEVAEALQGWRSRQDLWKERLGEHWDDEHALVFTTVSGKPISKRNIIRAFQRVLKRANVDHGTLKTLRSTVATQLAEAGVHPRKAQTFLGHAQMSTTMKYYTAAGDTDMLSSMLPDLGPARGVTANIDRVGL